MRLYLSYELFLCGNNINHEYFTNFTMYHNHIKCIMKRPSPCIMNGHFDLTWGEGGALIWGMTWFDYYSRMQNTAADTRFVSFTLGHACKKDNAYNLSLHSITNQKSSATLNVHIWQHAYSELHVSLKLWLLYRYILKSLDKYLQQSTNKNMAQNNT